MKKSVRTIALVMALTVASVTPVFATESSLKAEVKNISDSQAAFDTTITQIVKADDNGGQKEKAFMYYLVDAATAASTFNAVTEENSYIAYTNKSLDNAVELEKVAKNRVDLLTNMVKGAPSLQPQLDAAVAEYNQRVAERQAAEAAIGVAKDTFNALNASFVQKKMEKAVNDPDVIK